MEDFDEKSTEIPFDWTSEKSLTYFRDLLNRGRM